MKMLAQTDVISSQAIELLGEIKRAIRAVFPSASVLLYGSVARGTHGSDSDYDVLVLTDEALSKMQEHAVEDAILDLELEREVVISTMYYTRGEWGAPMVRVSPFYKEVERDAIEL